MALGSFCCENPSAWEELIGGVFWLAGTEEFESIFC
jgi:hypothetical protein